MPRIVILAGVAAIGSGMTLVMGGLILPSLFRPGTFVIGLGMLVSAVGGALRVARPPHPAS